METVWVTITQSEGEFLAAFETPEAAFDYYNVPVFDNPYTGVLQLITGKGDGESFAYPSMTPAEAAEMEMLADDPDDAPDDALPFEVRAGFHILLWDPIEQAHEHLILRNVTINK